MRPAPFAVLGTPRSGTYWMSKLLAFGGWTVHHEPSAAFRDLGDLTRLLETPKTGIVDSALTLRWRDLVRLRPDVRLALVHRPRARVAESAQRARLYEPAVFNRAMDALERAIDELRAHEPVLDIPYAALTRQDAVGSLFRHCLGVILPDAHWQEMRDRRVEVDVATLIPAWAANRTNLQRLYPELYP